MNLAEIMLAFNHKISGGSEYMWKCYGPNAWFIDFENNVSIIIDRFTREIYEVSWYPEMPENDDTILEVVWINPAYKEAYVAECQERKVAEPQYRDDLIALAREVAEKEGFNDETEDFIDA